MSYIKRQLQARGNSNHNIAEYLEREGFKEVTEGSRRFVYETDNITVTVVNGEITAYVFDYEGAVIAGRERFFDNENFVAFEERYHNVIDWAKDYV